MKKVWKHVEYSKLGPVPQVEGARTQVEYSKLGPVPQVEGARRVF